MKNILILFIFLSRILTLSANSTINFIEIDSLQQAIKLAKQENKLIFIDCSTYWCGHCKVMEETIFTHPKVAPFYNETFINIRINPDSKQWKFMKEKYPLHAYPTYLFIDHRGELQHMRVGGCSPKDIIDAGKTALDPKTNMLFYQNKLENGDNSINTLSNYLMFNKYDERKDSLQQVFLNNASDSELYSKESWNFLTESASCYDSIFIHFILKNYDQFIPQVGEIEVIQQIEKAMSFYIWRWGKESQREKSAKELKERIIPYKDRIIAAGLVKSNAEHFEKKPNNKSKENLTKSISEYSTFKNLNWEKLQAAAYAVSNTYGKHKDKTLMKKAIAWADKSIEANETLTNHYIKAKIFAQLGENDKAIQSVNNAIKVAIKGETYTANYISIGFLKNYLIELQNDKNEL